MKLVENGSIKLFENEIVINKELPKYIRIKELTDKERPKHLTEVQYSENPDPVALKEYENYLEERGIIRLNNLEELFDEENRNAVDFNISVSSSLRKIMDQDGGFERLFQGTPSSVNENSGSIGGKLGSYIMKLKNMVTDKKETVNLLKVFEGIKIQAGKEKDYVSRIYSLINLLKKAELMGQEAQKERIFKEMIIDKYESILWSCGYNRYISEEDLLKFAKESKKQLSLDYIKNYMGVIPDDVLDKKLKMDMLEIFDNYVVLHYDPDKKNSEMTKQEKEVAKDPILFGVLCGSKKLYYIADWIDENCDLTWKDLEEFFEETPLNLILPDQIKIKL